MTAYKTDDGSQLILGTAEECLPKIPAGEVGMILNDPPYNMTVCDWDKQPLNWPRLWPEIWRVLRPTGAAVVFAASPFTIDLCNSQRKRFRYPLVWLKETSSQHMLAKIKPMACHEDILVFGRGRITYYPQMTAGKPYRIDRPAHESIYGKFKRLMQVNTGERYPVSVLAFEREGREGKERLHPTQKPVALLEYLIKTYTREGEVVLDFTMGSGSTCIAAQNTGRRFIGIECNAGFYEIAKNRVADNRKLFAN